MHIAIIGNGIAGVTTARYIRKLSNHDITIISSETEYFYSRTALMYIFMGHMRFKETMPYEPYFWKKNRIDLVKDYVQHIDTENNKLQLAGGSSMHFDKLVLATGSQSNKFGWPGQDLRGVQGLYNYQDLQLLETNVKDAKRAVIVGGGLIGIELAEMLHSRNIPVTFLVRESEYWNNVLPNEEAAMVSRHIREHHFDLRLGEELKEIQGDEKGRVTKVITGKGEEIDAQLVGLTPGVHSNIDLVKNNDGIDSNRGVLINEYLQTNHPDIYACGDCAEFRTPLEGRRPIEQVWYTGKLQGKALARTICGEPTVYDPGIWYNSAKFLDIEYQVYGTVLNKHPEHQPSLYWEHKKGKKAIRIVYNTQDNNTVIGINLMGIRMRHEVCDLMLREKWNLKKVVSHLKAANFDPEFYKKHEKDVVSLYNQVFPNDQVTLKKSGLSKLIFKDARVPLTISTRK